MSTSAEGATDSESAPVPSGSAVTGEHSPSEQSWDEHKSFHSTGQTGADKVLQELGGLAEKPVHEHAAAYQSAHQKLTAVLDAPVNAVSAHHG